MIKIGVIGAGVMGGHHIRNLASMNVELVGISDIDKKRISELSNTYNTKGFLDYKELINEGLDAAVVAVPTKLHKEVCDDLIENGVDVLVEKPIADSIENAKEIIDNAKKFNVKLSVGHIERFNPAIQKLKELIKNDTLGKIVTMSSKRVGPYNPRIRDVGIIIDLGVHDIDIMSFLLEEKVKTVYATGGKRMHLFEDYATILMTFGNSCTGLINTNWHTPHKVRSLTIVADKGIAEVDYIDQKLVLYDKEWEKDAKIEKREPLSIELECFIKYLKKDIAPPVSGEEGLHALEVAISAIDSYTNNIIKRI
ncbi:MAG: putative oxidoreductase [Candidatus Methanofastidiosum methylothiophilum]|jgi:UDP-N-acetylglucosamine 3-dehydrogenase|uniref:Putative oxidoreductase n=1 Tax=Candidatus Methanofastidiosum methylothiophilum TaxID=1705564 RepID=A0A150JC80_9EURY|nr:MAG: putative oxidoreductase [Candidatus Methanofastidiosum methylthiophilus]MBP6932513.1 Gfo/Idh/MocA family oxidoreductase [Methanofastidiosum sp.]OQC51450.1 MAG: putative oxidoreductase [Euryarchaeota archaeon ADurb.Bin023]KYC55909.1 MAG: putative oxidoreductase [Candidatus Methanofastidiosum methylthiophilus]KYC58575.1 MAG: putative oxidoreductase [Candidatus Methanofastidiosum methylthiophilus]